MSRQQIVILGGYGQVGRVIARSLARVYPGRVTVAGRDAGKAEAFAAELGHGANAMRADVTRDADALLGDARLVVVCVDQRDANFAERCLAAGVHYVDVTAERRSLVGFAALDPVARRAGATAVISVGLAPGLTNLLVARAAAAVGRPAHADIFLVLGLGDAHGDAAIDWTLDHLDAPFEIREGGRQRRVTGFGERARFCLLDEARGRSGYRFDFSDQHTVVESLGLAGASTWLSFDVRAATELTRLVVGSRLSRLLRFHGIRRTVAASMRRGLLGSDMWAAMATVRGADGAAASCMLRGRCEAEMTGVVAAVVARRILEHAGDGGVRHIEQFVTLDEILPELAAAHPALRVVLPA
jgi:saccharopine dehydrogenase (NAD+, L-lysine-forming)